MKRRDVVLFTFPIAVIQAKANPLAFFTTPLSAAILQTLKSTLGFFIKEWLPQKLKNSTIKSLMTTIITALGLTEAINQIEHWASQGAQTVPIGSSVKTEIVIANHDVHDTVSHTTSVALIDKSTKTIEVFENFTGGIRVASQSGISITITASKMPSTGFKEIRLISDNRVIGTSPSIIGLTQKN